LWKTDSRIPLKIQFGLLKTIRRTGFLMKARSMARLSDVGFEIDFQPFLRFAVRICDPALPDGIFSK